MPADIVTGDDARDVAAYVAQAAAVPGEDTGRLAAVGAKKAEGTATAENGVLDIPMAQAGLAYEFADAEGRGRPVRVTSENPQGVAHNIAVRGNGVDEKGPVVTERRVRGDRRSAAGRVRVLLLGARARRRRHEGPARRRVVPRAL